MTPPPCPSSPALGFIDMETEEGFENANFESSEGKIGSESEGGPVSESERTITNSGSEGAGSTRASEGGDSPNESSNGCNMYNMWRTENDAQKECASPTTTDKVPLIAYEAGVSVGVKAAKERGTTNPGNGHLQVEAREEEVKRITRSWRTPSLTSPTTQSRTKVRFPIEL